MEEKQKCKISLPIILLFLESFIIIVMGIFIYRLYIDKPSNSGQEVAKNFKPAYYTYEYKTKVDDGFNLDLYMGFDFEKDGRVCAFLPGHENGDIEGTYSLVDDSTIKCIFTKYSNESSGDKSIKLDENGEVILKIVDDNSIKISEWTKHPKLGDSDLSFENDNMFTFKRASLELDF